jgi:hypothetical protein
MPTIPDDIARSTALRLAGEIDPALPALVEAQLQPGAPPRRFADPVTAGIALAALIVTAAKTGWDIYRDVKKDGKDPPAPPVLERRLRIELKIDPALPAAQSQRAIAVVVEEIARQDER